MHKYQNTPGRSKTETLVNYVYHFVKMWREAGVQTQATGWRVITPITKQNHWKKDYPPARQTDLDWNVRGWNLNSLPPNSDHWTYVMQPFITVLQCSIRGSCKTQSDCCTSQMDRQAHTDTGKNGQQLKMPDKYTVLHKWTGKHTLAQVDMDSSWKCQTNINTKLH